MILAISPCLFVLLTASLQLSYGSDSLRGTDLISKSNTNVLDIETDRCTTILVGAKAGANGPMVTHTADCLDCDFRVNKVPAADWSDGSVRETYEYRGEYPSTVADNRGSTWHSSNLEGTPEQLRLWGQKSKLTGVLPQVSHTFALIEAGYGIMNEFQVAIGESTCAAKFWAAPTSAGGKAQIEARELSRLALERTKSAKEAILLMGSLAETYGFYAADWGGGDGSLGEGGETLTVVDTKEAWVFHILADDTGTSAIWVAQRVPDDHIAAIANQFIIRHIDPTSPDFLYSSNIYEIAKKHGFWDSSEGPLDFLKSFAPMRAHPSYVTRRRWRVLTWANPSLSLSPYTDPYASDYPFSVPVAKPVTVSDLMSIQRDHYEGTEFDMTKGLAAGPFGDPNRFDMYPTGNMTLQGVIKGSFERAISLFRTSYSIVAEPRGNLPNAIGARVWIAQGAPATSSYVPFYVSMIDTPHPYTRGTLFKFNHDIPFWACTVVGNYAARFYSYAIKDINSLQDVLLKKALVETGEAENTALEVLSALEDELDHRTSSSPYYDPTKAVQGILTDVTNKLAFSTVTAWKNFFGILVTKYHDGYRAEGLEAEMIQMKKLFYPEWWLRQVGFFDNKNIVGPNVLMFQPNPTSSNSGGGGGGSTTSTTTVYFPLSVSSSTLLMIVSLTCGCSLLVGVLIGRQMSRKKDYFVINM